MRSSEFSLKNLFRRKTRTGLALLGIAVGVAAIVALVSIADGLEATALEAIGELKGVYVQEENTGSPIFSKISKSYEEKIEAMPGVKLASPMIIYLPKTIEDKPSRGFTAPSINGIDPEKFKKTGSPVTEVKRGRFLSSKDRYKAVIGQQISDNYKKQVGGSIEIDDRNFKIVGIYETGSIVFDNDIYVPLDVAQELGGMEKDEVNAIVVLAQDPTNTDKIAKQIEMRYDDLQAGTQEEFSEMISGLAGSIRSVTWAVSGIAAIVGGIGIANTMLMSVIERTREIGVLKSIGWSNNNVLKMIMTEAVLLGFTGGLIGIAIGFGAVFTLRTMLPSLNPVLTMKLVLEVLVFSMSLGILGGFYPAWNASKMNPIEALRTE
ncbi:MAG: ABC transporter permease [Candidatus Hydrothermarchaeota archaeon]